LSVLLIAPVLDAVRAVHQEIVEIHLLRGAGNSYAAALPLPTPGAIARRHLARIVAIGEDNHVACSIRQIEGAQPRGGECRPGRIAGGQQGGEAAFDAFADHEHVARRGEPHRAATAWAEHHLLRIDWRLAGAVVGKEGAVDCKRCVVLPARHQRDHRRPDTATRMFESGTEAERGRNRHDNAA
jgi:hypothetical protein